MTDIATAFNDGRVSVTVLMAARNAERTILSAVRSVLRALPDAGELLIWLDECTDTTRDILKSVVDERLRVFESSSRLGPSSARNMLLEKARGEFIAIVDSDDLVLPWHFSRSLKAITRKKVDFIFSNAILFGHRRGIKWILPQPPFGMTASYARLALGVENPFVHSSVLARKSAVTLLGGYTAVPSEDMDLWLRAALGGFQLSRISGWNICYRVHESQLSNNPAWQKSTSSQLLRNALQLKLRSLLALELGHSVDSIEGHIQEKLRHRSLGTSVWYACFDSVAKILVRLTRPKADRKSR